MEWHSTLQKQLLIRVNKRKLDAHKKLNISNLQNLVIKKVHMLKVSPTGKIVLTANLMCSMKKNHNILTISNLSVVNLTIKRTTL